MLRFASDALTSFMSSIYNRNGLCWRIDIEYETLRRSWVIRFLAEWSTCSILRSIFAAYAFIFLLFIFLIHGTYPTSVPHDFRVTPAAATYLPWLILSLLWAGIRICLLCKFRTKSEVESWIKIIFNIIILKWFKIWNKK